LWPRGKNFTKQHATQGGGKRDGENIAPDPSSFNIKKKRKEKTSNRPRKATHRNKHISGKYATRNWQPEHEGFRNWDRGRKKIKGGGGDRGGAGGAGRVNFLPEKVSRREQSGHR